MATPLLPGVLSPRARSSLVDVDVDGLLPSKPKPGTNADSGSGTGHGGKIVEEWVMEDWLGLMRQVGAVPVPGA